MATTVTVGTSGRNYSTIAAAEAAWVAGGYIMECYNDSEFTTTATTTIGGNAFSPTNYTILRCASGQSIMNSRVKPWRYDASQGVGIRKTNSYGYTIEITQGDTTIDGLQVTGGTGTLPIRTNANASGIVLQNMIAENRVVGYEVLYLAYALTGRNCLLVQRASTGNGVLTQYSVSTFVNCILVRPSNLTPAGNGFQNGGAHKIINCAVFGFTNFYGGTAPAASSSNNCSDVAITFGTNNQASKAYANQFESAVDSTRDFRTKTGADLLNNGATATADLPAAVDATGLVRPQGAAWDIGAWEVAASSSQSFMGMMVL